MPLIKSSLKSQLQAIQSNCPSSTPLAATQWATAVFGYSSTALAGPGLTPLPALALPTLQTSFLKSMTAGTFMDDLGSNLLQWWSAAAWLGPGFTGVTIPSAPLLSSALGKRIVGGKVQDVADLIATEIDSWTKTLQVTGTNVATGVTAVFPVS